MNKKSKTTLFVFSLLSVILVVQMVYLSTAKSMTLSAKEKKELFVTLTGLPDLALSTPSLYIRHRTLSAVSDIYSLDGCLREYDKATFSIANPSIANTN